MNTDLDRIPRFDMMVNSTGAQVLGFTRLAGLAVLSVVLFPVILLANGLRIGSRFLCRLYWRSLVSLTGSSVRVHGQLATQRPLLCVSNHASYLDILFLGSIIPGVFVSKAEVRHWPIFGLIARLGQTVFMQRDRSATAVARDQIMERLKAGSPVILFPEATSTDGNNVIPFKSSLFNAAEASVDGQPVTVQPITIAYTRLHGVPLGRAWRPFFAWFGDMEFVDHGWDFLKLGGVTVEVTFHDPVTMADFSHRKDMARHCHSVVQAGLIASHTGRKRATTPLFPNGSTL